VVDMAKNAEPEFRILVKDFPLGNVVTEMSGDESVVLEDLLDQRTDLLAAFDTRIVRQDAMTRIREFPKSIAHQQPPPRQLRDFTLLLISLSLRPGSHKIRDEPRPTRDG
jgi:hypothetical protein